MAGPNGNYTEFTPARQAAFLAYLEQGHNLTVAAAKVGVHRQTVYIHTQASPEFAAAVADCREAGIDSVEDLVLEMAHRPQNFLDRISWLKAHRARWRDDRGAAGIAPTINITIVAPSPVDLRDIIEGDYRTLSIDSERIIAPVADDTMLNDDDSST